MNNPFKMIGPWIGAGIGILPLVYGSRLDILDYLALANPLTWMGADQIYIDQYSGELMILGEGSLGGYITLPILFFLIGWFIQSKFWRKK